MDTRTKFEIQLRFDAAKSAYESARILLRDALAWEMTAGVRYGKESQECADAIQEREKRADELDKILKEYKVAFEELKELMPVPVVDPCSNNDNQTLIKKLTSKVLCR